MCCKNCILDQNIILIHLCIQNITVTVKRNTILNWYFFPLYVCLNFKKKSLYHMYVFSSICFPYLFFLLQSLPDSSKDFSQPRRILVEARVAQILCGPLVEVVVQHRRCGQRNMFLNTKIRQIIDFTFQLINEFQGARGNSAFDCEATFFLLETLYSSVLFRCIGSTCVVKVMRIFF